VLAWSGLGCAEAVSVMRRPIVRVATAEAAIRVRRRI
jgi:hypothetical protein